MSHSPASSLSAKVCVHKHYVYIVSNLICQFCNVQFVIGFVLTLYLYITFVAEDNCEFDAKPVTLHLKINIVLPDCMKWEDLSTILGEMCRKPV